MLIYGMRHYGKVDEIPGLGYVKTRFAHIWFLPLIPLGSMFITAEEGDGVRGLNLPLSGRSVMAAYGRTFAVVSSFAFLGGMFLGGVGLIDTILNGNGINEETLTEGAIGLVMGGGSFVGLLFNVALFWGINRFWGKANEARASEMLTRLGFEPEHDNAGAPEEGSGLGEGGLGDGDLGGARPL